MTLESSLAVAAAVTRFGRHELARTVFADLACSTIRVRLACFTLVVLAYFLIGAVGGVATLPVFACPVEAKFVGTSALFVVATCAAVSASTDLPRGAIGVICAAFALIVFVAGSLLAICLRSASGDTLLLFADISLGTTFFVFAACGALVFEAKFPVGAVTVSPAVS